MPRRYLDLLRVLAIFAVFATHVTVFCPPGIFASLDVGGHNATWLIWGPAWGGVWVFFVLAGYLTGKGFSHGRYPLTWPGCRRFWRNRFVRIGVPYYFAVLFVVVLTAPRLLAPSGWSTVAHMLTFTYYDTAPMAPLSQTWFVSTLAWLMVLAPLVALLLMPMLDRPRLAVTVAVLALGVGSLIRVVPLLIHPDTPVIRWWSAWMYEPVWCNIDLFVAGFLVNAVVQSRQMRARGRLRPAPVMVAVTALWFLTTWFAFHGLLAGSEASLGLFAFGGPLAWTAVTAVWICMAESQTSAAAPAGPFRSRAWSTVKWGAAVSYGVYLWHVPVLQSVSKVVHAPTPLGVWARLFPVALACTLVFAAVIRITVERAASGLRR